MEAGGKREARDGPAGGDGRSPEQAESGNTEADWSEAGGGRTPKLFQEELLRNPNRERLVDLIGAKPGLNRNLLAEELETTFKNVDFHLGRLEALGIVERRETPRKDEVVIFLPEDLQLWENPNTRILFGRSPLRQLGLYMSENPGATTEEAAQALGLSQVGVRYHIRTLREHDLLHRLRIDRRVIYHPTRQLQDWVEAAGQAYDRSWEQDDETE